MTEKRWWFIYKPKKSSSFKFVCVFSEEIILIFNASRTPDSPPLRLYSPRLFTKGMSVFTEYGDAARLVTFGTSATRTSAKPLGELQWDYRETLRRLWGPWRLRDYKRLRPKGWDQSWKISKYHAVRNYKRNCSSLSWTVQQCWHCPDGWTMLSGTCNRKAG